MVEHVQQKNFIRREIRKMGSTINLNWCLLRHNIIKKFLLQAGCNINNENIQPLR